MNSSRLTSGLVSPSELPDSPSQTVPPSPKPRKGPLEYPTTSRIGAGAALGSSPLFQRTAADGRPQPAPRSIQKPSVFEDNVTKFKEESTPVQFSSATSLSSLTIDDHDEASPSSKQVKVSIYIINTFVYVPQNMQLNFTYKIIQLIKSHPFHRFYRVLYKILLSK